MNSLISLWQDMSTMELVITLLIASNVAAWIKIGFLSGKFHLLNRLASNHAWIIRLKLGVTTIRQHRNGDFEIVDPLNEE